MSRVALSNLAYTLSYRNLQTYQVPINHRYVVSLRHSPGVLFRVHFSLKPSNGGAVMGARMASHRKPSSPGNQERDQPEYPAQH